MWIACIEASGWSPWSTYSKFWREVEQSRDSVVLTEMTESVAMMIDPGAKLLAVLDKAEEYRGLAIRAKDRRERESYVRIVELYVEIAEELEALIDGWASP
jgi:hypothetical protein